MANSRVVAGSTDRLLFTVTRNGSPWDLTAATVTVTFSRASGLDVPPPFERTLTVSDAAGGLAYYDVSTTDFDPAYAGYWRLKVRVRQGASDEKSEYIGFFLAP